MEECEIGGKEDVKETAFEEELGAIDGGISVASLDDGCIMTGNCIGKCIEIGEEQAIPWEMAMKTL